MFHKEGHQFNSGSGPFYVELACPPHVPMGCLRPDPMFEAINLAMALWSADHVVSFELLFS